MIDLTIEQLELPLVDDLGNVPEQCCELDAIAIPGLDASLCKCHRCQQRAKDGIWWVDRGERIAHKQRKYAYQFGQGTGDEARDREDEPEQPASNSGGAKGRRTTRRITKGRNSRRVSTNEKQTGLVSGSLLG